MRKKILITLWSIIFGFSLLNILGYVSLKQGWIGNMPDFEKIQSPISKFASQVFTSDGKLLGTWSRNENRIFVPADSISNHMFQALIATEDERFYEHSGVDLRALGRAIVKRGFMGQKNAGGGSTITQQLAKQLYSENATNTLQRLFQKPIEWVIATELERHYTKEEIMTLYLNYFDFLHNAVGIKTAANVYFNKNPKLLTLSESALLVGMCKNPAYFNPIREPERCLQRRNVVLSQMLKVGYIDQNEYSAAKQEELNLNFHRIDHKDGAAAYMREYLRRTLMADKPNRKNYANWQYAQFYSDSIAWETNPTYGWCKKNRKKDGTNYDLYADGLKIYTSIDSRMQRYAEDAVYKHLANNLQPEFNKRKKTSSRFPFSDKLSNKQIKAIYRRAMRQSERYIKMREAGASDEEIGAAFRTPTQMTVFSYHGSVDTTMTPFDSIGYYKAFLRSSLVAIDPTTGFVKAYVGGLNYSHFQYDMAMVGRRQIGSTMKPFVYAMALEDGKTPQSLVSNAQRRYGNWTPRNATRARAGQMVPMQWALAQSSNWATANLMAATDPTGSRLVNWLHNFGIANPNIHPSMALCLGPCEITATELASAYTAFVNQGIRSAPLLVTKIEDSEGHIVAQFTPILNEVLKASSAKGMLEMMRAVVDHGTAGRLRYKYNFTGAIAGKTGTTNNNSDGWFVGCVPKLVTAVWVGGDDRDIRFTSTAMGQGAATALPIWARFMKSVYADTSLGYSEEQDFNTEEQSNPKSKTAKQRSNSSSEKSDQQKPAHTSDHQSSEEALPSKEEESPSLTE